MSFFHVCSFITPIDADVHARDLPKLLHVLRPVFAPCEVSYKFGDEEIETAACERAKCRRAVDWRGEDDRSPDRVHTGRRGTGARGLRARGRWS
jgi:hypothetical protein